MLNDWFMRRVSAAFALSIRIMSSKKSADCAISVATPSPATSVAPSVDAIRVPAGSGAARNWLKWPKKKWKVDVVVVVVVAAVVVVVAGVVVVVVVAVVAVAVAVVGFLCFCACASSKPD